MLSLKRLTKALQGATRRKPVAESGSAAEDHATTRRALLTGGAAAGAAAVASISSAEAQATTYLKLGLANTATKPTTLTYNNGSSALTCSSGTVGVKGNATSASGSGVLGTGGSASGATGVKGTVIGSGSGVQGTSASGNGVSGTGGTTGVYGSGGSYGVIAQTTTSTGYGLYAYGGTLGAYASGASYGVYGSSSGGYGVYGSGNSFGVYGSGATGVYGTSSRGSGVSGASTEPNTPAVQGSGGQYGVRGINGRSGGVRGDSAYVGIWGEGGSYGANVVATATSGQTYGILAQTNSPAGFAGYFNGRVHVNGTLSKAAGSFRIDHPLDPERKWLSHSFVESPDMMNVYNGNVVTDGGGHATIKLPAYFGKLNRDFRYQLTAIGSPATAYVDTEIKDNRFTIRSTQPRVKVSWQVTGIRQDDYAEEHRIKVETPKSRQDMGTQQFVAKGKAGRLMKMTPTASKAAQPKAG